LFSLDNLVDQPVWLAWRNEIRNFDTVLEIREHRKDELTGVHTFMLWVKKQKSGEDGLRIPTEVARDSGMISPTIPI